jgi:hypothetical protein
VTLLVGPPGLPPPITTVSPEGTSTTVPRSHPDAMVPVLRGGRSRLHAICQWSQCLLFRCQGGRSAHDRVWPDSVCATWQLRGSHVRRAGGGHVPARRGAAAPRPRAQACLRACTCIACGAALGAQGGAELPHSAGSLHTHPGGTNRRRPVRADTRGLTPIRRPGLSRLLPAPPPSPPICPAPTSCGVCSRHATCPLTALQLLLLDDRLAGCPPQHPAPSNAPRHGLHLFQRSGRCCSAPQTPACCPPWVLV